MVSEVSGNSIGELEESLDHACQSFTRWREATAATLVGPAVDGEALALLAAVHKDAQAKTIHELLRLTHRTDVPIVQYQLRKLVKAGLIGKSGTARKGVYYQATHQGAQVSDAYRQLWRDIPLRLVRGAGVLEAAQQAAVCLDRLSGIYDAAACEVISRV